MRHISIDIEALGLTPNSVVLSIGAVVFHPTASEITPAEDFSNIYHFSLPVGPQLLKERAVDPDTVRWWTKQSPIAYRAAFEDWVQPDIRAALVELSRWILGGLPSRSEDVVLWANPVTFDIPALISLFEDFEVEWPIHHMRQLDGSTLQALTGERNPPIEFAGTPHIALDDAIHQAREIQWHLKKLGTAKLF